MLQKPQQAPDLVLAGKLQSSGTVIGIDVMLGNTDHAVFMGLGVIMGSWTGLGWKGPWEHPVPTACHGR